MFHVGLIHLRHLLRSLSSRWTTTTQPHLSTRKIGPTITIPPTIILTNSWNFLPLLWLPNKEKLKKIWCFNYRRNGNHYTNKCPFKKHKDHNKHMKWLLKPTCYKDLQLKMVQDMKNKWQSDSNVGEDYDLSYDGYFNQCDEGNHKFSTSPYAPLKENKSLFCLMMEVVMILFL